MYFFVIKLTNKHLNCYQETKRFIPLKIIEKIDFKRIFSEL